MVYLWELPENYPEKLIGDYDRERGPDRFIFKEGRRLGAEASFPAVCFLANRSKLEKYDALENNAMVPLVSERVAKILLEICPNDVELIDTLIVAQDESFSSYKIVNTTHRISCIDLDASEYTTLHNTDEILEIKKLRFLDDCLGIHDLVREDHYGSLLLVSKRLRDALIAENMKGITFLLPEEMRF